MILVVRLRVEDNFDLFLVKWLFFLIRCYNVICLNFEEIEESEYECLFRYVFSVYVVKL